jgi:trk/ktr system potassium uptake protein
MINFRPILSIIGVLLAIIGLMMLSTLIFSFYYNSGDETALFVSGILTSGIGLLFWYFTKGERGKRVNKREGYMVVALGWLSISIFGMLPYLFSGVIPNLTDAMFETVSGLTTTGASVLNDIESVPKGILFWRSMTQWIGGMGIIVLTVAIFPLLGIGGIELFVAESPGPTSDKIHPRIKETAKRLWLIYVSLTAVLTVILSFAGMTFYDAINHAMTTMSTGGFSTKNASVAHFDSPLIQYPIIIFMFLAGTNFTIIYFSLKGKFKRVWQSDEFRAYVIIVTFLVLLVSYTVYNLSGTSLEQSFRDAAFQVVSLITTTGYVTADYTAWSPGLTMFFFILMFVGASAGSTSGGIKIVRHLVFFKNSLLEFKRLLHPRAIIRIKIDRQIVAPRILTHILVFLLIYLILFVVGSIVVTVMGMDFISAIGAVATSLGNVGPGIGSVGPLDNFAAVPDPAKWFLSFLMLLGRLELFTILILFSPYFWKSN